MTRKHLAFLHTFLKPKPELAKMTPARELEIITNS